MKDSNVLIDEKNVFDQPIKNNKRTYDGVRKLATDQGDDYSPCCLLDYLCYKNYLKMVAIDLSNQQAVDANPKTIEQINFTGNPDQAGNTTMFFIIEEVKQTILDFSQGTVQVL